MNSRRLDRALYGLAIVFLAASLLLIVRAPAVPDAVIEPVAVDARAGARRTVERLDPTVATKIFDASIFSDSRTPPSVRYDPFQPDEPNTTAMPANVDATGATAEEATVPRLFGTVFGPDGPRALMQLDASLPGAQLYREGDRVGPYLVVKINEQSVTLDTSDGRIVLRLFRSEASTS